MERKYNKPWISSGHYHSNIGLKITSRDYLSQLSDKKNKVCLTFPCRIFPSYELFLVFQHLLLENIPTYISCCNESYFLLILPRFLENDRL